MDKRKTWREQEQRLVERWNAAAARQRDAHAEMARQQPGDAGSAASAEILLKVEAANAEVEALRREVARLKVEFTSGKRY